MAERTNVPDILFKCKLWVKYPFVNDERVEEELNFALSAFIFAVSRRFVSLKRTTLHFDPNQLGTTQISQIRFFIIDIAPELSGDDNEAEVDHEEGANDDEHDKVDPVPERMSVLY